MMKSTWRCWFGYCLSILFCSLLFEIADSDGAVRVQLHEYRNPKNLEYVSELTDTPYCCCNSHLCNSSMDSFTTMQCSTQCLLRVTVCLEREGGEELASSTSKMCYESQTISVPPRYNFEMEEEDSALFPNFTKFPSQVVFNLDRFSSDLMLTVLLEEEEIDGFETIDSITLPIDVCSLSSPTQMYNGMYGIASIDLAYLISITPEEYERQCIEPKNVTVIVAETVITQVVTVTQVITATRQGVTMETTSEMPTASPLVDAETTTSWMIITIALSGVLLVAAILIAFLIASLLCLCLRRRKSEVHESREPQDKGVPSNTYNSIRDVRLDDRQYATPATLTNRAREPAPLYNNVNSTSDQQPHHYFELTSSTDNQSGPAQTQHLYFELATPTLPESAFVGTNPDAGRQF